MSAYSIDLPKATRSVKATLDLALKGTCLTYEQVERNVIISKAAPVIIERASLIQGTVKDSKGQGMPGVNIIVKGTTTGTTTDGEGRFVIDAKESDVLVFSFIGFKPQEQVVGTRSVVEVVMEDDVESLKEVVVNGGYYQTTDKLKTGSIVRVAAKDIETQPVTSPLMALQGRMPGVDITPANGVPGSAVKVQIRGQNSLRTIATGLDGNSPLYVIDGVPVDSRPLSPVSAALVGNGFDPLSTINPSNIESIEVLKDADATSIYGSRGANGVILITTKRAHKSDRTNFELSAYKGWGQISRRMNLMNTQQYLEMRREAFKNDNASPGGMYQDYDLLNWDSTRYTDWQDVLLGGTSKITDLQGGISGGNGNTSFRLSAGFHDETLVFSDDFGYTRATGSFSLNHLSLNKKFRSTLSLNYGSDRTKLFNDNNLLPAALTLAPNAPKLYDDEGNLNWENSTWSNPLAGFRKKHDVYTRNFVANSSFSYDIMAGLTLKSSLGYTDLVSDEIAIDPINSYNPAYAIYYTGSSDVGDNRRRSWIIEPQISYAKVFGGGDFSALLGGTWQESFYKSQALHGSGYTSDALLSNVAAAPSLRFDLNNSYEYRYAAVFGRLGYSWKERYLINLSGRRDGSSRFGPGKRFANFGSLGVSWIFSNEDFIKNNVRFISFGKLRSSYGTTGNDQIGDYRFYDTYTLSFRGYQDAVSLVPTALFNPNLAWEITRKMEAALELGALDNRLGFEFALYRNRSSNQLVEYTLPYTTGFHSVMSNLNATVQNSGVEVTVRSDNVRGVFKWSTAINVSFPKSKLISFPGIKDSYYSSLYEIGKPLSILKMYRSKGVNSETGKYDFEDVNGDGDIGDQDNTFIQDFGRKYYGGVTNTFSCGAFELSFLFQISKQMAKRYSYPRPGRQGNQPIEVLDRWRKPGDVTSYQMFNQEMFGAMSQIYSRYESSNLIVTDASFVRLKTVQLSYVLPQSFLTKIRIESAKFYVQGQNILTITKYKGLDPETLSAMPPLRMVTVGFQCKI